MKPTVGTKKRFAGGFNFRPNSPAILKSRILMEKIMSELNKVFSKLRDIMLPYAQALDCRSDSEDELYVDTKHIMKNGKPLWFGAVQIKKRYVSYHPMPLYVDPELLQHVWPALKKRMQGKSCFNLASVDESVFKELAVLAEA